jgi:hypothetical protein
MMKGSPGTSPVTPNVVWYDVMINTNNDAGTGAAPMLPNVAQNTKIR